jgi:hypothetical protein
LRTDRWQLEGSAVSGLLDRLMATGQPLSKYVGHLPYSGLKTGFNAAHYIDSQGRDRLVSEHPSSGPQLKKFISGRGNKRPAEGHDLTAIELVHVFLRFD